MLTKITRCVTLALLLPALAWSQTTLRGQVRHAKDLTPLPFATVFLANTTRGVTADDQGGFMFTNVPVGKFDLVVSYVGFHPFKLTIQTGEPKFYRVGLQPDEKQLAGVTVKARRQRDPEWAKRVEFFVQHFIGRSENARQCFLKNPNALFFEKQDETLVARASGPLVLENRGLGYQLTYVLNEFRYDYPDHRVQYTGDAVFEPMKGSDRDQQRWAENRRKAYHGSLMHFMRALYRRQSAEEGFAIMRVTEHRDRNGNVKRVALPGDEFVRAKSLRGSFEAQVPTLRPSRLLDSLRSTPANPVVAFTGLVQVTYTREPEPVDYQRTLPMAEHGHRIRPQTTLIRMAKPEVTLESDGRFYDPHGIRSQGYWSWEVIGEELPFDYNP